MARQTSSELETNVNIIFQRNELSEKKSSIVGLQKETLMRHLQLVETFSEQVGRMGSSIKANMLSVEIGMVEQDRKCRDLRGKVDYSLESALKNIDLNSPNLPSFANAPLDSCLQKNFKVLGELQSDLEEDSREAVSQNQRFEEMKRQEEFISKKMLKMQKEESILLEEIKKQNEMLLRLEDNPELVKRKKASEEETAKNEELKKEVEAAEKRLEELKTILVDKETSSDDLLTKIESLTDYQEEMAFLFTGDEAVSKLFETWKQFSEDQQNLKNSAADVPEVVLSSSDTLKSLESTLKKKKAQKEKVISEKRKNDDLTEKYNQDKEILEEIESEVEEIHQKIAEEKETLNCLIVLQNSAKGEFTPIRRFSQQIENEEKSLLERRRSSVKRSFIESEFTSPDNISAPESENDSLNESQDENTIDSLDDSSLMTEESGETQNLSNFFGHLDNEAPEKRAESPVEFSMSQHMEDFERRQALKRTSELVVPVVERASTEEVDEEDDDADDSIFITKNDRDNDEDYDDLSL